MLRKTRERQKGQALVEFALVLPLLLLLLFGIVEFGRIFAADLMVIQSAREGARVGAVGEGDTAIIQRVRDTAAPLDPSLLEIRITPGEEDRTRGAEVRVEVSYPVQVFAPFISIFTGEVVTVEAMMTMRVE
jgi:Flp pilus assembly protein TadG